MEGSIVDVNTVAIKLTLSIDEARIIADCLDYCAVSDRARQLNVPYDHKLNLATRDYGEFLGMKLRDIVRFAKISTKETPDVPQ